MNTESKGMPDYKAWYEDEFNKHNDSVIKVLDRLNPSDRYGLEELKKYRKALELLKQAEEDRGLTADEQSLMDVIGQILGEEFETIN